ncbi:hypothetical protein Tco_0732358 [Tanacetum coccineum]
MSYKESTSFDIPRMSVLQILWGIVHYANLDYASLIWDKFEWQALDMMTSPTKQTKLIYPRFTKLFIDHYLSTNKSIPRRSDADMYVEGQDLPLLKLINTVDGELKFRLEIPDSMINDPLNSQPDTSTTKLRRINVRQTMLKRNQKSKMCLEQEEGRKRTITYADNLLETEYEVVLLAKLVALRNRDVNNKESKLESIRQEIQASKGEGSSAAKDGEFEDFSNIDSNATTRSSWSNTNKDDDIVDAKNFDMDIFTCSSLEDYINLLNDQPENELTNLLSRPVYTYAQTTFVVANPEGNPEITSYLLGAYEVPFGTNVDVKVTEFILQELFEDTTDHQVSSAPATTTHNLITNPQQSSIQAKAKKLVKKAMHTMLNFKKAVEKKFKEYDQKLEALSSINVPEAIEEILPIIVRGRKEGKEGKRKDTRESSSKSSKKDKSPMDFVQDGIPADKPQDKEEELI